MNHEVRIAALETLINALTAELIDTKAHNEALEKRIEKTEEQIKNLEADVYKSHLHTF